MTTTKCCMTPIYGWQRPCVRSPNHRSVCFQGKIKPEQVFLQIQDAGLDVKLKLTIDQKLEKTFPAASRALRWGPGELFDTSAACEEHLGSRPATETLLKSFGDHSGAPRPHWWRWRCHPPSMRDCLLPISVSSPLQCQSATLRRTCILSHLSSHGSSVTEPFLFIWVLREPYH